jgi:uncharacterized protein YjbI with pentapeptide repeats
MKLTKKQLIERWTPEMKEALVQRWRTGVIGESPFGLTDEDRHDFRGCPAHTATEFCNLELSNYDFSYFEFQRLTFRNCKLVNWYCEKLKCTLKLRSTAIIDCHFINADLTSSSFGPSVIRCEFIKCRLYDMYSDESVFEDCLIANCKVQHMPATISYIRTKFVGPLHRFYFCQKIERCDFTEAQFDDCGFQGGTEVDSIFSNSHHIIREPSTKAVFFNEELESSRSILTKDQYIMANIIISEWLRIQYYVYVIDEESHAFIKEDKERLGFVRFMDDTYKKYQTLYGNV